MTSCFPTMVNWKLFVYYLDETNILPILFIPANCTISNLYSLNDNSWDNLGTTYAKIRYLET